MIDGDSPMCRSHYPKAVESYHGQQGHGISLLGIVRSVIVKQILSLNDGWWDFLLTIVLTAKSATIFCMLEGDVWNVLFCFVTREGLVRDICVLCCGHSVDLMRRYFNI